MDLLFRDPKQHISKNKDRDIPYKSPYNEGVLNYWHLGQFRVEVLGCGTSGVGFRVFAEPASGRIEQIGVIALRVHVHKWYILSPQRSPLVGTSGARQGYMDPHGRAFGLNRHHPSPELRTL